ncbi:MAG: hypothetical protein DDT26_00042 [Dehalococcoidia bacterium]|nr:hypothetical protein [Chloroflexota bacterium]
MIPQDRLSTQQVVRQLVTEHAGLRPTDAYHRGGVALNDPSLGLDLQLWSLRVVNGEFLIRADQVPETVLFSVPGEVSSASLAFDQNMRSFVVFVEGGIAKYRWFDTLDSSVKITTLPGASSVKCCTDDLRVSQIQLSDIIMAYIGPAGLCYRQQRDRYTVERVLAPGISGVIQSVGMNRDLRLQFKISSPDGVPPAMTLATEPPLGEVVINLAARAGLVGDKIDVSDLYEDKVYGYGVASTEGVDAAIKPLAEAYGFDPVEYDKRLRFKKRGRSPIARVRWSDLVNLDPPIQRTRDQEDELPSRVHVSHLDPDGGFAKNQQHAHRRSNQVRTKRERKLAFNFVLPAEDAANIAMRELKREYREQMGYKFALGPAWSFLTPTDVIEFEDRDGSVEIIRIEEIEREDTVSYLKGRADGGLAVYGPTTAASQSLQPPRSTTPGLVGETRIEILNVPVLRDQNDELGLIVAVAGQTAAWSGVQVMFSTDAGQNYTEAFRTATPAVMGESLTVLFADGGGEYPGFQTVDVQTNFELASVTRESLLSGANRAVIGDEVIQFQTAVHLGNSRWRLSGLIRGRYETASPAWPVGTRFVVVDEGLVFAQLQRWMVGVDFRIKAVSFGSTLDETVPLSYLFDEAVSQTEWRPKNVTARRSGSDYIVEWNARPRLGVETNAYHSKFFRGHRLKFSDGQTIDVPVGNTHTRAGAPPDLTVVVHGLNDITGEGPASIGATA